MNIGVFAASSSKIEKIYIDAAERLGDLIASEGHNIVYGGGGIGLMGAMADKALKKGAKITGVIPSFMQENGWGHNKIDELIVTEDMGSRKKKMFELSDAIIALPGGIGTLEELTEAITMKQLGLFKGALVIINTSGFYEDLIFFLQGLIRKGFMHKAHRGIWEIASTPEEALDAIRNYNDWYDDPVSIARL